MNSSREALLQPALEIPSSQVAWYFLSAYYDGPIFGLAIYKKRFVRFCCFEEDISRQTIYVLQEISEEELAEEKRIKAKFERMVGSYGCFDETGALMPGFVADEKSRKQFFEEEQYTGPSPTPYDRPIIAWFDVSKK